jgi:hypothetical protein
MWRTLRAAGLELLAGRDRSNMLEGLPEAASARLRGEAESYLARLPSERLDLAAKANELGVAPDTLRQLLRR